MLLAFSAGCCPRIDWYRNDEKQQGSLIIQAEKVNGNCNYLNEEGEGLWMCGDSWWYGTLSDIGKCEGWYHASIGSKPKIPLQDDSLQWKWVYNEDNADLKFNCVDVSL